MDSTEKEKGEQQGKKSWLWYFISTTLVMCQSERPSLSSLGRVGSPVLLPKTGRLDT